MKSDDTILLRIASNKSVEFLNEVASKWLNDTNLKIYNMLLVGIPITGLCRACKCNNTSMRRKIRQLMELMRAYCWRHYNDHVVMGVYMRNLTKKQTRMIMLLERKISQRTLAKMLGVKQNAVNQMGDRIMKRLRLNKEKDAKHVVLYLRTVLYSYKFSKKLRGELNEEAKALQSLSEPGDDN